MDDDLGTAERPLEPSDVDELLRAVAMMGWDEARIVADGITVVYSRSSSEPALGAAKVPTPVPPDRPAPGTNQDATVTQDDPRPAETSATETPPSTPATSADARQDEPPADGHVVKSPSLGLFWRSPQPGAPPFVEVGDEVEPDTTVCIIEVMKLMNHVKAGVAGRVVEIHQENSDMVEFDAPLVTIAPE